MPSNFAVVADGVVTNIVVAEADYAAEQGWIAAVGATIGDTYADGVFSPRVPTLAEAKAAKLAAIDARKDAILLGGYHPVHAALAGEVLQNRPEDRDNWNMALDMAKEAVAAGGGALVQAPFRTASNTTVVLSFTDAVAVLRAFRQWGIDVLKASWLLKDAVAAAANQAALDAVDIEAGWP